MRNDLLGALRAAYPDFAGTVHAGGYGTDRIEWDEEGRAYTVLTIRLDDDGAFRNVLMASIDGCVTWQVIELPYGDDTPQIDPNDRGNVVSEHSDGGPLDGPPLIAVWRQLGPWKGEWSSLNELQVIKPYWSGGMLALPAPVTVSSIAQPILQGAGGASFAVTRQGKSHFVYCTVVSRGERTTPTFAATYDEATNTVGPSAKVASTKPGNDLHCTPGICMDGAGILHVVAGAHGYPFRYTRSLAPQDATSWSKPVNVLSSGLRKRGTDADGLGNQTYLSLVCGPDDVVHCVSRQSRRNVDGYFPGSTYCALVHQSLGPGQTAWSAPDLIIVPPLSGYSQYFQKLTVDRLGRLFVSCSYFSRRDPPATRTYRRFHHRMVLVSEDGGHAWRFATTADFLAGVDH